MKSDWPLLIQVLRRDRRLASLTLAEWDLLIRQAKRCQLHAKLFYLADDEQLVDQLPAPVFRHLQSARVYADKQYRDFLWEVGKLKEAFAVLDLPLILLKGGGYAIAQLPPYRGRLFSDIDILVPFSEIDRVEKRLMIHGWIAESKTTYDQRYYRRWMHELPPLHHVKRGSVVDLHHNILPRTAEACPDADLLLQAAQSLDDDPVVKVLSRYDRVIHSATHLFFDGEFENGLRDLVDLSQLIGEFTADDLHQLVERARQLGLARPVYYAFYGLQTILNVPGLKPAVNDLQASEARFLLAPMMNGMFANALMPDHASCRRPFNGLARWLLYVRSHWLKMPPHLLVPHLLRKTWMRFASPEKR